MLFRANFKTNKILVGMELHEVNRGEFITSIENLTKELNECTPQKLRTFLKLLENDKMIIKKSTCKLTKITICNYDSYQGEQQTNNIQTTYKQHTANKQITTENKENKDKKDKKVKKLFIDSEYSDIEKLKSDLAEKYQKYDIEYYYDAMLNWSEENGEKKLNWLATCRTWMNNDEKNGKAKYNNNGMVY